MDGSLVVKKRPNLLVLVPYALQSYVIHTWFGIVWIPGKNQLIDFEKFLSNTFACIQKCEMWDL